MAADSTDLLWINPATSRKPSDRTEIRRDVMRNVALRKKRGKKSPHPNRRQFPLFISNEFASGPVGSTSQVHNQNCTTTIFSDESEKDGSNRVSSQVTRTCLGFFTPTFLPASGKNSVHYLDLSLLASLEVGRYTGQKLLERPQNITQFLGGKNWSYFRYVPLYYDKDILIRNATDCVLARVKCSLSPDSLECESLALRAYLKALASLQDAINSSTRHLTVETLCATQILGLYEVSLCPTFKNPF